MPEVLVLGGVAVHGQVARVPRLPVAEVTAGEGVEARGGQAWAPPRVSIAAGRER